MNTNAISRVSKISYQKYISKRNSTDSAEGQFLCYFYFFLIIPILLFLLYFYHRRNRINSMSEIPILKKNQSVFYAIDLNILSSSKIKIYSNLKIRIFILWWNMIHSIESWRGFLKQTTTELVKFNNRSN